MNRIVAGALAIAMLAACRASPTSRRAPGDGGTTAPTVAASQPASPEAASASPSSTPTAPRTAAATATASATATATPGAVVDAPSLNVRAGPSVRHPIVGTTHEGEFLDVVGRTSDGSWLRVVAAGGADGWVNASYLQVLASPSEVPVIPTPSPPAPPTATSEPMDPASPLVLAPPRVAPGSALRVVARAPGAGQVVAALDPMAVPLYPTDDPDVFGGFLAVPPDWAPGTYSVSVTAVNAAGDVTPLAAPLEVVPAAFPAETITLAGDALQLLDPVLRQNELQRLDEVWKRSTPGLDWQAHWAYPRKAVATSGYGVVRTYEPGDTPGRHLGLDLRGDSGDPVAAAAPGTVALAERLTVRGSTVLVDHGWGVFTAYYHLSSIDVTPGQRVAAGAILGRVGATGMVTGPHLHWEVRVAGVAVDPVPWVSLGPPGS